VTQLAFEYDESRWPIVRVICPNTLVDDATFERHLQGLTKYLERRCPLVFVIELGLASNLSVQQRERIRRHETEHRVLISQFQRGKAIVARSAFQRAMIRAVFWLVRSPNPTLAFASVESAVAWGRALLGEQAAPTNGPASRAANA
jgi:hypothetical protein